MDKSKTDILYNNNFGVAIIHTIIRLFDAKFKKRRIIMMMLAFVSGVIITMFPDINPSTIFGNIFNSLMKPMIITLSILWFVAESECYRKMYNIIQDINDTISRYDTGKPSFLFIWSYFSTTFYNIGVIFPCVIILICGNILMVDLNNILTIFCVISLLILYRDMIYTILPSKFDVIKNSIYEVLVNENGEYSKLIDDDIVFLNTINIADSKTIDCIVIMTMDVCASIDPELLDGSVYIIISPNNKIRGVDDEMIYRASSVIDAISIAYTIKFISSKRYDNSICIIGDDTIYNEVTRYTKL